MDERTEGYGSINGNNQGKLTRSFFNAGPADLSGATIRKKN